MRNLTQTNPTMCLHQDMIQQLRPTLILSLRERVSISLDGLCSSCNTGILIRSQYSGVLPKLLILDRVTGLVAAEYTLHNRQLHELVRNGEFQRVNRYSNQPVQDN